MEKKFLLDNLNQFSTDEIARAVFDGIVDYEDLDATTDFSRIREEVTAKVDALGQSLVDKAVKEKDERDYAAMKEISNAQDEFVDEVGWIGLIASFLFPLLGIVMYWANRHTRKDCVQYVYSALIGIFIGIIIRMNS